MPFDLTKKIGPLPTWGWLAVGGGGGAFILYRRHQAAAAAAAAAAAGADNTAAAGTPGSPTGADMTIPGGSAYGIPGPAGPRGAHGARGVRGLRGPRGVPGRHAPVHRRHPPPRRHLSR